MLDLFCNATNPGIREQTAEMFAKMLSDKLVGPKIRILLTKFLPPIFMDAMRDSAEASVHMFEGEKSILPWGAVNIGILGAVLKDQSMWNMHCCPNH